MLHRLWSTPESDPARALRRWLVVLNGLILVAAGVLSVWVGARALWIALLVPFAFVPFAVGRLRMRAWLGLSLAHRERGARVLAAFGAVAVACDAVMVAQLLTARTASEVALLHGRGIGWVGPVWFSANELVFLGAGLLAGGRALARLAARFSARPSAPLPDDAGETIVLGRRAFLERAGVLGVAAPVAVSLTGVKLSYDFRVEEREIALPHWPRALDGLRVAHLSDIHVGGGMDLARLMRVAALTNAARPDVVLHTGDFLTHRSGEFDTPLYEALARIEAPLGQWACLGNHDYEDPERLVEKLAEAGVVVLQGRAVELRHAGRRFEVAGLDFAFGRVERAARAEALLAAEPRRDAVPRILLNHDPSAFAALPPGCADLVLSGHTHGGHVGLQLGPSHALTFVGLLGIPDQGVFSRGDMRLFVTRCVGFYGYPMRLGIPPEIALLTLRSAPEGVSAGVTRA